MTLKIRVHIYTTNEEHIYKQGAAINRHYVTVSVFKIRGEGCDNNAKAIAVIIGVGAYADKKYIELREN
nr:hypothetical protein [uncultured Moellerella sp.]